MKKLMALLVLGVFCQGTVFAAPRGTAEYERLKELKKAQREARERGQANAASGEKGFWAREAERSGLAGTGAMFSNTAAKINPLDSPAERRAK